MSYLNSEKHFRLYEPFIKQIVDNWPKVTRFAPKGKSTETLSSRIRICGNALFKADNMWATSFDLSKFIQIWDDVVVAQVGAEVICGPSIEVRKSTPSTAVIKVDESTPPEPILGGITHLDVTTDDGEYIAAILVMHHYQHFIEPSIITTTRNILTAFDCSRWDIAVEDNGDGSFTIL